MVCHLPVCSPAWYLETSWRVGENEGTERERGGGAKQREAEKKNVDQEQQMWTWRGERAKDQKGAQVVAG